LGALHTLKTPIGYSHTLDATGEIGSISVARFHVIMPARAPNGAVFEREVGAWIGIAQDPRLTSRVAMTSDPGGPFAEGIDLVAMKRRSTGDRAFDHQFASFADEPTALSSGVTPSLRKLLLSWQLPVHAELRAGGFIVAPVSLPFDPASLSWFVRALHVFGDKAAKVPDT
jgi:hypothetical protein